MSSIVLVFQYTVVFFGLIYAGLIIAYTIGWFRMRYFNTESRLAIHTKTSIIIPARNEEENISDLLGDLIKQTVDKDLYEIVVVDDHSTDRTAQVVRDFIDTHPGCNLKLLVQSEVAKNPTFKKKAIERGISESTGELIITTDADCRMGEKWLETIIRYYETHKPALMVGPVNFYNEKTLFEKIQTPEFLSLIAITAGAISIKKPIMCNGANLAYQRKIFIEAGGYGGDRFSSGDDVFLMLRIAKMAGNKAIRFIKNVDALVFTEARKTPAEFYQQRTRWASKNKGYDINILFVSVTVYLVNLLQVAGIFLALFFPALWIFISIFTLIKVVVDLPVIIGISTFVQNKKLLLYALPLIFVYPFYIVITGAMGIVGSYTWKDRKVKN
ncbi:MAG: glycosyltransferase [Bacteroidales bacterium]|nr:glycosyltransferase [Bacteroidales bacterium]